MAFDVSDMDHVRKPKSLRKSCYNICLCEVTTEWIFILSVECLALFFDGLWNKSRNS